MVALAAVLAGGWILTNYLGEIQERNIEESNHGDLELLSGRLTGETAIVDAMAKMVAASLVQTRKHHAAPLRNRQPANHRL